MPLAGGKGVAHYNPFLRALGNGSRRWAFLLIFADTKKFKWILDNGRSFSALNSTFFEVLGYKFSFYGMFLLSRYCSTPLVLMSEHFQQWSSTI